MQYIDYILLALLIVVAVLNIVILLTNSKNKNLADKFADLENDVKDYMDRSQRDTIDSVARQMELSSKSTRETQIALATRDSERFNMFSQTTNDSLDTLRKTVSDMTNSLDSRMTAFQKQTTAQMETIRQSTEKRMADMQASNEKKLEEMRRTVDEKLQKTLEERINQSFKLVSDRLDRVYKSLGEMQKVGAGVEDLKKVLSNVKTRGILGEVQLGAILEEILSPEQYEVNIATKKGSADRVEFAVKLPGEGETPVYLPIDAKFPLDAYQNLLDAYDSADPQQLQQAVKELKTRIKGFGKDIHNKYIDVPNTTEFAIMFLPVEGLYAEAVKRGLVEELQKDKINLAGPTTMAALLNSLQMGFRTLAIQKSSGQVWKVLGEVKTEFEKFETVLDKAQQRMQQASQELDSLVGTRTRAINRKLRDVSEYTALDSENISKISEKI
ncbi:MAG: DNA recombination protein RmuC [Oscillospiraceae bacterium]|nr:DNA recombination protein RmuC [Oscillospiraceae bacterium]